MARLARLFPLEKVECDSEGVLREFPLSKLIEQHLILVAGASAVAYFERTPVSLGVSW